MAITKILARNGGLKQAIEYVLNGDKTQEQVLTAHLNCDPGFEYQQMMDTKRELGKLDGRQCYHIIQSFVPGEITPELALQIATEFASEYLVGYQVVIGTHTDRHHRPFRFITTGNTTHQQSPTLRKRGAISTSKGECYEQSLYILRRTSHHAIRPAACHDIGDFPIRGLYAGADSELPGSENWQPDCNSEGRAAEMDS